MTHYIIDKLHKFALIDEPQDIWECSIPYTAIQEPYLPEYVIDGDKVVDRILTVV